MDPTQGIACDWSDVEIEGFVSINFTTNSEEKYPSKLHARGVAQRLGVKSGLIYLPGLPQVNFEDSDQPVKFRQRRYFFYLSGLDLPNCFVTYDIKKDTLDAWIPPPNSGSTVIYNGSNPTREEIKAKYDFDKVHLTTSLEGYLRKYAQRHQPRKIFLLHPYQTPRTIQFDNGDSHTLKESPFEYTKLKPAMDAARAIKSHFELKLIRKASAITAQAHINVLRGIKYLENEAEIEAIFAATCISQQAKNQAYGIIAGSGENASTLHYVANNEPLKGRQLVCLDAGVEWKCYASDVTRTFPISGEFTPEAKEIYDIVEKMQEECISMVAPGVSFRDIHLHAHKVAIEGLMKLNLLQNGTFEDLYKSGASMAFFPHGLGHYLGLECHDVGEGGALLFAFKDIPPSWSHAYFDMLQDTNMRSSSSLAPNMVITVEPGIYFSRYALEEVFLKDDRYAKFINKDLLDKYYPVGGVRIEDDILVTEDGFENLTTAPKGNEALKIINEGKKSIVKEKRKKGWLW